MLRHLRLKSCIFKAILLLGSPGLLAALYDGVPCLAAEVQPADGVPKPDAEAERIKNLYKLKMDAAISIQVIPIADGKFAVVLEGKLKDQLAVDNQVKIAKKLRPNSVPPEFLDIGGIKIKDPEKPEDKRAKQIEDYFVAHLHNDKTKVKVIPVRKRTDGTPELTYDVFISGELDSQKDIFAAEDTAEEVWRQYLPKDKAKPDALVELPNPPLYDLHVADAVIEDRWPLIALGSAGSVDNDATRNAIADIIKALTDVYGTDKDHPVVVTRDSANLYLRGPRSAVYRIKSVLALVDTTFPQVQLDMWAVQASGPRDQVSRLMSSAAEDIEYTQRQMKRLQLEMQLLAQQEFAKHLIKPVSATNHYSPMPLDRAYQGLFESMTGKQLQEATDAVRPYSLIESLIVLSLSNDRTAWLQQLSQVVDNLRSEQYGTLQQNKETLGQLYQRADNGTRAAIIQSVKAITHRMEAIKVERALNAPSNGGDPYPTLFSNLKQVLDTKSLKSHQGGAQTFLERVHSFRVFVRSLGVYDAPRGEALTDPDGYYVDAHDHRFLLDEKGYRIDLTGQQILVTDEKHPSGPKIPVLGPLYYLPETTLEWRKFAPEELAQAGAATDRLLKTIMEAFSKDLEDMYLNPLLTRIRNGEGLSVHGVTLSAKTRLVVTSRREAFLKPEMTSQVNTTRPAPLDPNKILGGSTLNDAANLLKNANTAALLTAVLANDVPPVFTTIAPGVEITATPSVSPDGSAADLTLDASFGVETTEPDTKSRQDLTPQAKAAAIQRHHIKTRADVDGFELFNISAFDISTTHPHPPFYIPVLGRLPLFGPMFQIAAPDHRVEHQSLICVNAAILPRSLGLAGFYGARRAAAFGALELQLAAQRLKNLNATRENSSNSGTAPAPATAKRPSVYQTIE